MRSDDYVELTDPEEVIREGDEFSGKRNPWGKSPPGFLGAKLKDFKPFAFRFRRPRSTVIRDAAEALLRAFYGMYEAADSVWPEAKVLREALGKTVEELRGKS